MTVDVVIPYSPEHTTRDMLDRALGSVNNQTVDTNPIVVQDDEQEGPAYARNIGLERSQNRYVAFLDADDYWKPEKLEKQVNELGFSDAGICLCKQYDVNEDLVNNPVRSSEDRFIRGVFLEEIVGFTSTIVVDTWKVKHRFNEDIPHRAEHLYVIEAADQHGVCFVSEILSFLDKHSEGVSATQDIDEKILAHRKVYEEVTSLRPGLVYLKNIYWRKHLHRLGRVAYHRQDYQEALSLFTHSLDYRFSWKTLAAFVQCLVLRELDNHV